MFRAPLSALLVLAMLLAAQAVSAQVVDKMVAQVNGKVITLFELDEKLKTYVTQVEKQPYNPSDPRLTQMREQILQTMVDDILLRQEAARLKITITDTEAENRIREMREKAGLSNEQFNQQLRLEGLTRKGFVEDLKKDLLKKQLLGYMVQRKVLVTEEEVRKFYEANKAEMSTSKGQRIAMIMVTKLDEAKALKQRIASRQISFADAARKHSIGPGAEQGGDLGRVSLKDLAPELQKALTGLPPGGVSDPVLLDGKPVLLTLSGEETTQTGPPPFDSMREEVYDQLYRTKLEKQFRDYLSKLRSKAVIKINL